MSTNDRVFWMDTNTGNLRVGKIGTSPSPLANLTWTAAGVLALNSNTTAMVSLTAAGVVTVGPVANNRSRIVLDSDPTLGGVRLIWRNGSGVDTERVALLNNGNVNISGTVAIGGSLSVTATTTLTGNVTLNSNLTVNTGTISWAGVGTMNASGIQVTVASGSSGTNLRSYQLVDSVGGMTGFIGGYRNINHNVTQIAAVAPAAGGSSNVLIESTSNTGAATIQLVTNKTSSPTVSAGMELSTTGLTVTGTIDSSGYIASTASQSFRAAGGSTTVPSYTFAGDLTRGMSSGGTGLSFITNSLQRATITSTGITVQVAGSEGNASIGFANGSGLYYSLSRVTITSATNWVFIAEGEQARFRNGSATTPSIVFASETFTGIYYHTTNTIGFSTNGLLAMSINGSNLLSVVGAITSGANVTAATYFTGQVGGFAAPAFRFATTNLTGMFGSNSYIGLEVDGVDIFISRLDADHVLPETW